MTSYSGDKLRTLAAIAEVFRPYTPIDDIDLFAGRVHEVAEVLGTVYERGRHVVIHGDRGVGKTSLANVMERLLDRRADGQEEARVLVVKAACDSTDNFSSVWRRVFNGIALTRAIRRTGFRAQPAEEQLDLAELLPEVLRPADIVSAARTLGRTVVILDEFDRLQGSETARAFADTLKALSDADADMTVVIVGVGRSVTELIGEHESVERCLKQVGIPRMSDAEADSIVTTGLARAGMTIQLEAKERIIRLSQGFPHYTHLLAKNAAEKALGSDRTEIEMADVEGAIAVALEQAAESVKETYRRAVTPQRRQSLFDDVLLACALAAEAGGGTFGSTDVREALERITGQRMELTRFSYNLGKLCSVERGPVLDRLDYPGRPRYRFRNPLLQPYIVLQGHSRGAI